MEKFAMSAAMREELVQLRRRKPFQPFRVHLKNGETYEVRDSSEFLVGDVALVLPVRHPTDPDKDYGASLSVDQVVRIEPLEPSSVNGRSH
jgi:hypothetical protein